MATPNGFDDLLKLIDETITEISTEQPWLNILVAGKTGVGKSTLINAIFGEEVAETGTGRPVTEHLAIYEHTEKRLRLFDTRGLEVKAYDETVAEIRAEIERRNEQSPNPDKHIHLAWICIAESSDRVEEAEIDLYSEITRAGIPAIFVVTKATRRTATNSFVAKLRDIVAERQPGEVHVVAVNSREVVEIHDESERRIKQFGLDELVHLTNELLPEAYRSAFARAQKIDRSLKRQEAERCIGYYAVAAAGVAATPIPFSDAIAIVPIQVKMLVDITRIYGRNFSGEEIRTILYTAAAPLAATVVGRWAVSTLLKWIPGVGSIVGGTISATVAGALTYALGKGYLEVIERDDLTLPKEIGEALAQILKNVDLAAVSNTVSTMLRDSRPPKG